MTIADRIRNRRLELGLSVDDLAKLLNKNRATVYRYESNYIKTYQPDVMQSLAVALQTTPSYFYGYDDGPGASDDSLSIPEQRLVTDYRALSPRGQQLLVDRAEELKLLYGKKSESPADVPVQVKP